MKKLLPLFVLIALTAGCDDGRLYMEKDWYLSGGGEQQLFKQLTVTRKDVGSAPAAGPLKTRVTISSNRTVSKTIWSMNSGGTEGEMICEGNALLTGLEYQSFTSLAAEARFFEQAEEPAEEGEAAEAPCPVDYSFLYEISYDLMDGRSETFTSLADACPFDEAFVAVINKAMEIASTAVTDCSPAAVEAEEPRETVEEEEAKPADEAEVDDEGEETESPADDDEE